MRYANLRLAMDRRRCTQCMLSALLRVSEPKFSRKMHGHGGEDFLPHEKNRIATSMGFDLSWLFAEAAIPASAWRENAMFTPTAELR